MSSTLGDLWRRCRRWRTYAFVVTVALVVTASVGPTPAPALPSTWRAASPTARVPDPAAVPSPVVPLPIAGWIIDGAGQPIAGVRVTLRDPAGSLPETLAESGAEGEFRIAPSTAATQVLLLDAAHVFPAQVPYAGGPPPRIMLARRASVQARVTLEGVPVAGAEVRITDGSQPTLATARTDLDGMVRFGDLVPGPYELWATRQARTSPIVRIADVLADSSQGLELALRPAGSVRGQVIAAGQVAAGATVQLTPLDIDHAVRTTTLDDRGRFAVEGVPHGRWRVEVTSPGYVQSFEQSLQVMREGETVVVRLDRAGTVSGVVVNAVGDPVVNATIVVRHQGANPARPIAQQPLSSTQLRWVYPFAGRRQLPTNAAARFGASRPGTRAAECGQGHCGIDLVMPRGAVVHATADGEVVAAYTELRGEAGRFVAIDHGDGLETLYMHLDQIREGLEPGQKIRAGDSLGTVGSTGFDPTRSVPHLHFAVTQHRRGRTWYLDPEPMLRHAVVLATPRPLDHRDRGGLTVAAAMRRSELAAPPPTAQSFTTDARGAFRVDGVEPGSYVTVAFAVDLAPGASDPFTVRSGSEVSGIVVTLGPGVLVHGRIVDRNQPISGATVTASAGFGETASKVATTYSNPQGEFVLRALAGKVTLSVTAPSHGEATRTIALDVRDRTRSTQREDFTLTIEDAQLRGQVLSPDGGAAGIRVRVVEGPTRRTTLTDPKGQFAIDRVATGRYIVELSSIDYPVKRVTLDSDRWQEVRLDQGGGVRCLVSDSHSGAPLVGMRVEATGPDGVTLHRTSDARGIVELRGLVAGGWRLSAGGRGYAMVTQQLAIRATRALQDARLDLAKGATLAGVVRDRRGSRVAGARVWLGTATTQSDGDGNFRLTEVAIGAGVLQASLGDQLGALALQLAPGDERVTLSIELSE